MKVWVKLAQLTSIGL